MTTFDTVYEYFSEISVGIDTYFLPKNIEEQHKLIANGIRIFNSKLDDNLKIDITTEEFSRELSENEITLFAHCMKLHCLNKMYLDFINTYSMFQKEIGFKDYKAQVDSKLAVVEMEKEEISDLVRLILPVEVGE